jgi:hypothetical protein
LWGGGGAGGGGGAPPPPRPPPPPPPHAAGNQSLHVGGCERRRGAAMTQPFRRGLWSRVGLRAGAPLAAAEVTPDRLRERVAAMLAA